MNLINRNAVRPALLPTICWPVLLAASALLTSCGGKDQPDTSVIPPSPDATGGSGGGTVSSGGAGLGGMQEIITSTELRVGDTGGAVAQAGSAGSGQDVQCDMTSLTMAVTLDYSLSGPCYPRNYGLQWGNPRVVRIVIDEAGRMKNTGREATDALAQGGWTCVSSAGMEIVYLCMAGDGGG